MTKKSKGLGIGALLSGMNTNIEIEKKQEIVNQLSSSIVEIALDKIEANPFNPRIEFDEEALQELSESIKTHGLIQPITVRHLGNEQFQLISGERRFRASKMAGLQSVPAYVRIAGDEAMLELALIENIQREDLNAIEVASTYERLMDELKLTHDTLSKRVGKKRSTVTNYLRLLKLPVNIQTAIKEEQISMGHARALINVEDPLMVNSICKEIIEKGISVRQVEHYVKILSKSIPEVSSALSKGLMSLQHAELIGTISDIVLQITIYKEVIKRGLSVEETKKLISEYQSNKSISDNTKTPGPVKLPLAYRKVQENLRNVLNSKVQLKVDEKGKGQIIINFEDTDDFNRIIDMLDK
jgi:ParB family chromosome partitioning protein